jgi:hypothetical protein
MSRATAATALDTKKGLVQLLTLGVWGSLGVAVAVALAGTMFVAGTEIAQVDQQRFHIPGHWVFFALTFAPGLLQLVYVIPLHRLAKHHGLHGFAPGLLVGATLVGAANVAVVAFLLTMPSFD